MLPHFKAAICFNSGTKKKKKLKEYLFSASVVQKLFKIQKYKHFFDFKS